MTPTGRHGAVPLSCLPVITWACVLNFWTSGLNAVQVRRAALESALGRLEPAAVAQHAHAVAAKLEGDSDWQAWPTNETFRTLF